MTTIIKNTSEIDWLLRDTKIALMVRAGEQLDLESAGLNRNNIALSSQILVDLNSADLGLILNDGTKDLNADQAARHILLQSKEGDYDTDGAQRVTVEKTDRQGTEFISPNWGDKKTWFYDSIECTNVALTPIANNSRVYVPVDYASFGGAWVQSNLGLYSDEDTVVNFEGKVPRLSVFIDSIECVQLDPEWYIAPDKATPGDYVADYDKGHIIFHKAPPAGAVVTATLFKVRTSMWCFKPKPGTKLKIHSAEAQFSRDISLNDTTIFETWGLIDILAPQLVGTGPGQYPSGTVLPLYQKKYKTLMNFIDEANGALPIIPQTTNQNHNWRDLPVDVSTFPWDYRYTRVLSSAAQMEVRVYLEHDVPHSGIATATFYTIAYPE